MAESITESATENRELTLSSNSQSVQRGPRGRFLTGHAPKSPGRPKAGSTIAHQIRNLPATTNKAVAQAIVKEALAGDSKHARILIEYQDGLPQRTVDVSLSADSELMSMMMEMREAKRSIIDGSYRELPDAGLTEAASHD